MSTPAPPPYTAPLSAPPPPNHILHSESTTTIFLPDQGAFLNPVQHYNRDMSVAVIRSWNQMRKEEAEAKFLQRLERRGGKPRPKRKGKGDREGEEALNAPVNVEDNVDDNAQVNAQDEAETNAGVSKFRAPSITILEALAATGLRSIRYAKEIPDVKYVLANDLSPSACEAMRRNVEFNGVGLDYVKPETAETSTVENDKQEEEAQVAEPGKAEEYKDEVGRRPGCRGRVKVNEGDACAFMYNHRAIVGPTSRVDVVDLDPYGTAAPFLDAAIGCIADGGLLAITCTDLAVLAGQQYPEKCYSNYSGTNVHAEFTHEAALRLVYHSLATTAARYGRYITPLLSFSIDFYVRLFVRIHTGPEQVKKLACQTGVVYTCQFCQTPVTQPFGRTITKETANGRTMQQYKTIAGPPAGSTGSRCAECGGTMHLGGPLWLGPLQDTEFAKRVIGDIEKTEKEYKTYNRMHGMLSLAASELPDLWFFTANRIAKSASTAPLPMSTVLSCILNGGYKFSRSHCAPGAIKTDAPRSFLYDIMRIYARGGPDGQGEGKVDMSKIPEGSPTRVLLGKELEHEVDFTIREDVAGLLGRKGKETFYQINPLPNWGPAPRAKSMAVASTDAAVPVGEKRKVEGGEEGEGKKVKVQHDEEEMMDA